MTDNTRIGILFLVVGPSGAGKDTLIDGARDYFSGNPHIDFPHRYITRSANAGGENHLEISSGRFATMEANGDFALSWRAHGHIYGVLSRIDSDLTQGVSVLVNISRAKISEARQKFSRVHILNVTVDRNILRQRLITRGRETSEEIDGRIARADAYAPPAGVVTHIDNSQVQKEAVTNFCNVISDQLSA